MEDEGERREEQKGEREGEEKGRETSEQTYRISLAGTSKMLAGE